MVFKSSIFFSPSAIGSISHKSLSSQQLSTACSNNKRSSPVMLLTPNAIFAKSCQWSSSHLASSCHQLLLLMKSYLHNLSLSPNPVSAATRHQSSLVSSHSGRSSPTAYGSSKTTSK
jgi:hypothetical protein